MTTLIEVAKLAGVGKSTVSRVINNDPLVAEETRKKILDTISKCGYKPNSTARSLKKQDRKNLAIVIPHGKIGSYLSHAVNAQKIEGIASQALLEDYRLTIIPEQLNNPDTFREAIYKNDIDGVFILTELDDESLFDFFAQYSIQVMLVNWQARSRQMPFVMTNHDLAAQTAAEYLAKQNCKRIAAMNCLRPFSLPKFEEKALKLGLSFTKKWFWEFPAKTDADTIGKFFEQYTAAPHPERPDCIYISNNHMAADFIEAATKNNIHIPSDLKLVAFDDMLLASYIKPSLTCLRQNGEEIGRLAIKEMLKLLNKKTKNVEKMVPAELIKRKSA